MTEVCHAVGYSSLGSFSSRFREIVGETPRAFQSRYAVSGAPRIPGCWVFMAGLVEKATDRGTGPDGIRSNSGEAGA